MMPDLEGRLAAAKFAEPGAQWEIDGIEGEVISMAGVALHFDLDASAACSLLPKLAPKLPRDKLGGLIESLSYHLWHEEWEELCFLILSAVKEVQGARQAPPRQFPGCHQLQGQGA